MTISFDEWIEAVREAEASHPHDSYYTKENGWYTKDDLRKIFIDSGMPHGDHYIRDKIRELRKSGKLVSESATKVNDAGVRRHAVFYKLTGGKGGFNGRR